MSGALNFYKLQSAVVDVERLGEVFLENKDQILQASKRHRETEEAVNALRKSRIQNSKTFLVSPTGTFLRTNNLDAIAQMESELLQQRDCLDRLHKEQKRLIALLAEKGASPESVGPGLLGAMLNLVS